MYKGLYGRMYTKAYICHPYTAGVKSENVDRVREICKKIVVQNQRKLNNEDIELIVPVAPHLLFPEFMSEPTLGREVAMDFCKALLLGCDEIWVFDDTANGLSAGMKEEISFAGEHFISIVFMVF